MQDFENEVLIYDLTKNKAYCLNQTSALVWQNCNGNNSVADISCQLSSESKTDVSDEVVWLALDGLKRDDLLENGDEFEINFNGLNRRQLIKKVGLASMIALPVISAIVAPTSAAAQSNLLPFLAVCTADGQCASGNCDAASFGGSDGVQRCCIAGTTGGTRPGNIIAAASDLCFPNCTSPATGVFCCSGVAQTEPGGNCGSNQQFRCSCV
ncbi:MAG: PqqD family protein [Blastocatellia bacterium]|nr:PqqD family protein [Blastocatellia bacterium]